MTVKFIHNIKTFHLSLFVDLWIKASLNYFGV